MMRGEGNELGEGEWDKERKAEREGGGGEERREAGQGEGLSIRREEGKKKPREGERKTHFGWRVHFKILFSFHFPKNGFVIRIGSE